MKLIKQFVTATLASLLLVSSGYAVIISGGFTGNWFNPETSGQGFQMQVLPNGRALALWFTYDAAGNQVWLIGDGQVEGNSVQIEMVQPVGASFGAGFDPDDVESVPFGTISLTFNDCNSGTVDWNANDPQFGSGSMPVERLTTSAGVNCTGSVADNNSGADPVVDFRIPLLNEGVYPQGSGHADYESYPGDVEFEVEIEDVPVGSYKLLVDGTERGTIEVTQDDDGTEGEIEFSGPQSDDDLLLDFDPLGALIEIDDGSAIVFSAVLDPGAVPPGGDEGGNNENAPPFGSSETEVDFVNTGIDADASGDVELEQRPDRVDFDVEIEDLDVGLYELWVGSEIRGEIEVVIFDDGTEGELEFRNPVEAGKLPLDFNPIGQRISIEREGSVFLEVQFPSELGGSDDDDDDDDDDDGGGD